MTTPDIRGLGEDVGMIEVVSSGGSVSWRSCSVDLTRPLQYGASISTFTRTITLALHHLNIPYVFHNHAPHSAEVKQHNPLGLVPVLIHRPNPLFEPSNSLVLYESSAIRRYIDDALYPIAKLRSRDGVSLLNPFLDTTDSGHLFESAKKRARLDQIVSLTASQVFPALEFRIIKPRLAMEDNKADEGTIAVGIEEGVEQGKGVLALLENFLKDNQAGKSQWFIGDNLSWADLYVYPILADLKSIPEVSTQSDIVENPVLLIASVSVSQGPKLLATTTLLKAWVDRFEATSIAKATYPGSIPDKRSKSGAN